MAGRRPTGAIATSLPPGTRHDGIATASATRGTAAIGSPHAMSRKLRHATSADLARLARLHAFCFPEDRWDERALAELLAMPGASAHLIENVAEKQPLALILD